MDCSIIYYRYELWIIPWISQSPPRGFADACRGFLFPQNTPTPQTFFRYLRVQETSTNRSVDIFTISRCHIWHFSSSMFIRGLPWIGWFYFGFQYVRTNDIIVSSIDEFRHLPQPPLSHLTLPDQSLYFDGFRFVCWAQNVRSLCWLEYHSTTRSHNPETPVTFFDRHIIATAIGRVFSRRTLPTVSF